MITVLMTLHIILAMALVGIILIQKNEGGLGMGSGAMGNLMSSRGTANLLTRVTAVLAALFFITTLGLALAFKGANKPHSIFDTPTASKTIPSTIPLTNSAPVVPNTSLPADPSKTSSAPSQPVQEGSK